MSPADCACSCTSGPHPAFIPVWSLFTECCYPGPGHLGFPLTSAWPCHHRIPSCVSGFQKFPGSTKSEGGSGANGRIPDSGWSSSISGRAGHGPARPRASRAQPAGCSGGQVAMSLCLPTPTGMSRNMVAAHTELLALAATGAWSCLRLSGQSSAFPLFFSDDADHSEEYCPKCGVVWGLPPRLQPHEGYQDSARLWRATWDYSQG